MFIGPFWPMEIHFQQQMGVKVMVWNFDEIGIN